jgi:hypothetical protein
MAEITAYRIPVGFGRAHTVAWHRPLLQPRPHLVPVLQPQYQPGPRAPDWAGVFAGPPRNRSLSFSPPKAPKKFESPVTVFAPRIQRSLLQHVHMPGCFSPSPCAQLSSARSRHQIWSLYENRVLSSAQALRRHLAACVVLSEKLYSAQKLALRESDSAAVVACRRSVCIVQKNRSHCQHRCRRRHALCRASIPPSLPARCYPRLRSRPREDAVARPAW